MRVKRYVADTIQEAIARVKNDLGRNAIILHTKPFKEGGFLGLFRRRRVEVIAAVDEETKNIEPEKRETVVKKAAVAGITEAASTAPAVKRETNYPSLEPELNSLKEEIAEVKQLIRQSTVKQVKSTPSLLVQPGSADSELRQKLGRLGLADELVNYLIEQVLAEPGLGTAALPEKLEYCRQLLEARLKFSEPVNQSMPVKREIMALIGPTGVGKTTTIAKLAANFSLFQQRKVGLVTIDTYRIAAVEHLKTYGEIMNLPVEVVYAPSDLQPALSNLVDCDLVLIDTAGRSPYNRAMLDELRQFLETPDISVIFLVISATTQYRDMLNIMGKFSQIAYTHLVFTKLDETDCLGPLVSLAWEISRPISYLTTGQNVPDDIEPASPDKLITQLFEGLQNG